MKKISLITIASVATAAAFLWSMPAAAEVERVRHDLKPWGEDVVLNSNTGTTNPGPTTGVPEPGMLVLLALGLGSVGFVTLRRKRARV